MEESLYYKEMESRLFIRANGHITAALCTTLRKVVFARVEAEPQVQAIYVDLSHCDYMDSTFMGLLVGFNKRIEKLVGKKIDIVQPTEGCIKLLQGLGITRYLHIMNETVVFPETMENIASGQAVTAELLLKAHEDLIEISEENKKKFSLLHSILKKQAEQENK